MQSPNAITTFQIITLIISSIAIFISIGSFGLASYSLYLQRRDKRPRLQLSLENRKEPVSAGTDKRGGAIYKPTPAIVLHASNPTDKNIIIKSIKFEVDKKSIDPPLHRTISQVDSHNLAFAIILIHKFDSVLKQEGLSGTKKGSFVLTDALGNKYKIKITHTIAVDNSKSPQENPSKTIS